MVYQRRVRVLATMPVDPVTSGETRPRLHPSITAALERDGISLTRVAELVGLDVRTVQAVRLDGEAEKRAARYRRLDAWIEGRARAVQGEPDEDGKRWKLEELSQDVTPAEVAGVADRLLQRAVEAEELAAQLRAEAGKLGSGVAISHVQVTPKITPTPVKETNRTETALTRDRVQVTLGSMLNPALVRSMSSEMARQTRGAPMQNVSIKLPEGYRERIEQAADAAGVSWAEYLRILGWMFSKGDVNKSE